MNNSKTKKFDPIFFVDDDKLTIQKNEAGEWAYKKLNYLGNYCNIFTSGMRNKWDKLIYIDLFAGSGYNKSKNGELFLGSPLIAMKVDIPFTNYLFVEKDIVSINALQKRVERDFANLANFTQYYHGSCNDKINEIYQDLLKLNTGRVLCFAFVDPYNLDINFDVINKLSDFNMDFMIHLSDQSIQRNIENNYLKESNKTIDLLLNDANWRDEYNRYQFTNNSKIGFIFNYFLKKMELLGYKHNKYDFPEFKNSKNAMLYHLGFFSKHSTGIGFFKKITPYSQKQQTLGF